MKFTPIQLVLLEVNERILKECRGLTPFKAYKKSIEICKKCIYEAIDYDYIPDMSDDKISIFSENYASNALNKLKVMELL